MRAASDLGNLIVVSTDFSDCGDVAIPHAFRLANDRGGRVVLVHVLDANPIPNPLYAHYYPIPTPDQIRQAEEKAHDALHARIPPEDRGSSRSETVVTHGAPAAEILRVATERSASLIVIGTHGRTGLIRLALGSVAERVVGEATCPVLVGPLTSGSASRRHVIVVGAGPAGAALSLLLARNGVRVTLVERERDFDRAFRGEALMPTGLDALYAMGIRAKLDSLPWRPLEAWEIYLDRRPIMHVNEPTAELGDRALRVVPQPQLL